MKQKETPKRIESGFCIEFNIFQSITGLHNSDTSPYVISTHLGHKPETPFFIIVDLLT